jgi:hypothetical protein
LGWAWWLTGIRGEREAFIVAWFDEGHVTQRPVLS